MGWLLCRKHPDVITKGSKIPINDLYEDVLLRIQHRFYVTIFLLSCFVLPTIVPHLMWGESLEVAYFLAVLRYIIVLHNTWTVNSVAHLWGDKPYDININPVESRLVSFLAVGEGFHNYHR